MRTYLKISYDYLLKHVYCLFKTFEKTEENLFLFLITLYKKLDTRDSLLFVSWVFQQRSH